MLQQRPAAQVLITTLTLCFELVDPPAAARHRPDFLDAVASPLRSFLESVLHHGNLPADVLAQLDHCSAVLNGLQSALLPSDSSLPEPSLPSDTA